MYPFPSVEHPVEADVHFYHPIFAIWVEVQGFVDDLGVIELQHLASDESLGVLDATYRVLVVAQVVCVTFDVELDPDIFCE